jgi:hypothetical protein
MKLLGDILAFLCLWFFGGILMILWTPVILCQLWKDFRLMQQQDRQIRDSFRR